MRCGCGVLRRQGGWQDVTACCRRARSNLQWCGGRGGQGSVTGALACMPWGQQVRDLTLWVRSRRIFQRDVYKCRDETLDACAQRPRRRNRLKASPFSAPIVALSWARTGARTCTALPLRESSTTNKHAGNKLISLYSWIAVQRLTHQKSIRQHTRRATTIPRPPLEISWQGEFRSAVTIFVKFIFGVLFFETCENRVPTKIVTADLDSPRRIL